MSNSPLTNQTYINKDFQTIYPELLELVKNLTYKWDPTVSNESDPGVLLIKLNAIIADKNNYNIDKNILECFPDSVTQYDNAFKLFSQLGYNMHWYQSAKGTMSMKWKSDPIYSGTHTIRVKIPQFTMISDEDKELVYTTLHTVSVDTDGTISEVGVIQGVIRDYTVGSGMLIKPTMLDYRNRLYFPIRNVAENGVFILNKTTNSKGEAEFVWDNPDGIYSYGWKRVDNLNTQPLHTKCYKFGVDQSNNSCYIEFPEDITDLMGEGIRIKYIQSDGASGNIAQGRISKFYEDLSATFEEEEINISDNVNVANYSSITNGKEPEDISNAYGNYQKTVGTFDTLVTLRDYLNFIVNEEFEQSSNGFITDRTNDIQSSYDIIIKKPGDDYTPVETFVDTTTVEETVTTVDGDNVIINKEISQMDAYDLKTYLLEYSQWPKFSSEVDIASQKNNFKKAYDKSFKFKLDDSSHLDTTNPLATSKTIEALFEDSKTISHDFIPKLPHKILMIKNKFNLSLTIIPNDIISQAQADDIERNVYETVLKRLHSKNISFGEEISYEMVYDICNNADSRVKAVALDNIEYTPYAVVYIPSIKTDASGNYADISVVDEKGNSVELKVGLNEVYIPKEIEQDSIENLNFNEQLALEICVKNILKGVTPLFHEDNTFKYHLGQTNVNTITNVERISTSNEIIFKTSQQDESEGRYTYMEDGSEGTGSSEINSKMFDNEALFLYSPSLTPLPTFSAGIKYVYITDDKYVGNDSEYIPANKDYVLQTGQHLFLFWKDEDSDDAPYLYQRLGKGTIINATTRLIKHKDKEETTYYDVAHSLMNADYTGEGQIFGELNDKIKSLTGTILSTNKSITPKEIVAKELTDPVNYCYWITNDTDGDNYKITYKYVDDYVTPISESYQSGYIYLSNFDWTPSSMNDTHTLLPDEQLIILKPNPHKEQYNQRNDQTKQISVSEITVKDYTIVANLKYSQKETPQIRCTSKIHRCPYDDVFEAFKDPKDEKGQSITTLKWGKFDKYETADVAAPWAFNFITLLEGPHWTSEDVLGNSIGQTYKLLIDDQPEVFKTLKGTLLRKDSKDDIYTRVEYCNGKVALYPQEVNGTPSYIAYFRNDSGVLLTDYPILSAGPLGYNFKPGDYFLFQVMAGITGTSVTFYTQETVGDGVYQIPKYNDWYNNLENMGYCELSNGYKIELLGSTEYPTFEPTDTKFSKFEYLVKTGEEFIYAFEDMKGFEMLGHGTKITLTIPNKDVPNYTIIETVGKRKIPKPITHSVPKINSDNLHEQGVEALRKSWYPYTCSGYEKKDGNIKSLAGILVTITENQVMMLGEGTYIRVKRLGMEIPTYDDEGGGTSTVTKYDERFANLKISSEGVFVGQRHEGNGSIDWKFIRGALSNYLIQYRTSDDESWSNLPATTGELGWDGYTILNINSGANNPQIIDAKHSQKMTLHRIKDDGTRGDVPLDEDKLHIQTSVSMNLPGGSKVDVTRIVPDTEEVKLLDVITYKMTDIKNFEGGKNVYEIENGEKGYELTFNSDVSTIEFGDGSNGRLGVRPHTIMPVEFTSKVECINKFIVYVEYTSDNKTYNEEVLTPMNFPEMISTNNPIDPKIYYYNFDNSEWDTDTTITSIRFEAGFKENATDTDNFSIIVRPLVKYDVTLPEDDLEIDKKVAVKPMLKKIQNLDKDGMFYYTYSPSDDIVIYDPLLPNSYFNDNHKYNKFTIPQIGNMSIKVMNKR